MFFLCSPLVLLQSQVSEIIRLIHKQLKDKSIKTRQVMKLRERGGRRRGREGRERGGRKRGGGERCYITDIRVALDY